MAEGWIDTNGVRLWYGETGDPGGEAVVLLMGAGASVLAWPAETLEALAGAGYRVVRFDNRDIGLSTHLDPATSPYTLDDLATDTLGLMDHLGIGRAHLVGASMGGMVAQSVALRQPDRVRSLTLLITTPGPDERLPPPSDRLAAVALMPGTTPEEVDERTVALWRVLAGTRFPFDEARIRADMAADAARGTNPAPAHALAVMTAPSRLDDLPRLSVPALVVHGTEDPIFPVEHAHALAAAIPGAELVVWDGVGHEVPPQLAGELIERVLAHLAAAGDGAVT
jgi:pimeloyl-ACP methyl ester carboxylesterase